jgi:NitT/TauT family transport system substrate-binding protein
MGPSTVTIGHLSTFYHTSFILEGTGWLNDAGLDVEWQLFASGPDMMNAFEAGAIDLGYLGLPPTIIGISRGAQLKCVGGGHMEGTVMIAKDKYGGVNQLGDVQAVLQQFEGGVLGPPPRGSIHDVIARDLIGRLGLDIEVENFPWADYVLEALIDDEIAVAAGTPPLAVIARRYGGAKIVVPPHLLWPNNPSYGIIARKELMVRPEVITTFLEKHEQASRMIREDPRKAAEIVSKLTGTVDPEFVQETYAISPKYCAALSPEYISSTMAFVKVLEDLGYISRPVSEGEIFERAFIDKVHPERSHYR